MFNYQTKTTRMKKNVLMLGLAAIAFTACTNEEVTHFAENRAIGFDTFVGKNTKAVTEMNTTVLQTGGFYVWGGYDTDTDIFAGTQVTYTNDKWEYTSLQYWENGKILWITSKDMKSDLIEDTIKHINMLGIENSAVKYNTQPSVLFVTRSGILRRTLPISMVKKPFTVNQDLKVLTPSDINLEYLFWACKDNEHKMLEKCMKTGTTVENINTDKLMEYTIPIAPILEQLEIVQIINNLLEKESKVKEAAEQALRQIEYIKKSILAKAFRGELGTNDPQEESSLELLKQIIETGNS